MPTIHLTEDELATITNALHTAAQAYRDIAQKVGNGVVTNRLADQFVRQAEDVEQLAQRLNT